MRSISYNFRYISCRVTTAGNFHIQAGSNVIDQGTSTNAPSDDIDGEGRPNGGGIDMGADEYY